MPKRINISETAIARLNRIPGMKAIIEEHGISYGFEFIFFKLLGDEIPPTPKELKSLAAQGRWDEEQEGKRNTR